MISYSLLSIAQKACKFTLGKDTREALHPLLCRAIPGKNNLIGDFSKNPCKLLAGPDVLYQLLG